MGIFRRHKPESVPSPDDYRTLSHRVAEQQRNLEDLWKQHVLLTEEIDSLVEPGRTRVTRGELRNALTNDALRIDAMYERWANNHLVITNNRIVDGHD